MINKLMPVLAAFTLLATGAAVPSYAQKAEGGATGAPTMKQERKIPSNGANLADKSRAMPAESRFEAADLLGKSVLGPSGKEIAKIAKVLPARGPAREVVLNVGGMLGFGAKQVLYPASKIELGKDGKLYVALTEEQLNELAANREKRSN